MRIDLKAENWRGNKHTDTEMCIGIPEQTSVCLRGSLRCVMLAKAGTQSLARSGQWSLFTNGLGSIHMPLMNGIRVQVGACTLIGRLVWHFTSLSITPTITSWHFCIRLIFRPVSLDPVSVCVSVSVCWKWQINPIICHHCKHLQL